MREDLIRAKIVRALDAEFAAPSSRQQEELFAYATGGKKMKRGLKFSFGLALALVLTLLTVTGAVATMLLSAQEVVENTAVPMAKENDTDARVVDTYTPEQLTQLIKTANENGITLDETAGIMRALRSGKGYWEDEAVMEICRAAFGGLFPEWTIEEKRWYSSVIAKITGYPESEAESYPLPGPGDMQPQEARETAARLLKEKYPEAAEIENAGLYRRIEFFSPGWDENDQPTEPFYSFDFKPLDLRYRAFSVVLDRHGAYQSDDMTPSLLEGPYTARDLESAVGDVYRAATGTQFSWSQEAWHAFGEYLPQADRSQGWGMQYDAYLQSVYPLPTAGDMPLDQAVEIAKKDAGCDETGDVEKVLLSDGGAHVWKISFQPKTDQGFGDWTTWEIDAGTGEIRYRGRANTALRWSLYVLSATCDEIAKDMLKQEEALGLAADALRTAYQDDSLPFTDPATFQAFVSYMDWRGVWSVRFRTKDLRYGSCAVQITEPDHVVTVTEQEPMTPDGDSLYRRWQEVYSYGEWDQETWIAFSEALSKTEPKEWKGKLLQKTVYPPLSAAKITLDEAVDVAARANDWPVSEATRATLLSMDGKPVWKIRLSGRYNDWLYEIDGDTGAILNREAYKPDNYDFDDPVSMFTLRRDYAPAFLAAYGPEWAANVALCKAFADLSFDEPDLGCLDESLYQTTVEGHTVTFTALQKDQPSYRVVFTEEGLVETAEKLP